MQPTLLDAPLAPELIRAASEMGYQQLTDVQQATVPLAIEGQNLLVCARTGSGKTASFLFPVIHRLLAHPKRDGSARALILVPTRELALQTKTIFDSLAKYTQIKAGVIMGGEAYKYQVATLRRNPEVIIATPGRLIEHLNNNNTDFHDLEMLVLDEADRMLDMGFQEAMGKILMPIPESVQKLFYSATLQHKDMAFIQQYGGNARVIEIDNARQAHENIVQFQILVDDLKHRQKVAIALTQQEAVDKILIFCNTRAQSQQISNLLQSQKIKAGYIHGELGQNDRKQILNRFRDGHLKVLVATDVAARGLDIPDVDLVINYNVAHSGDDHVHRIGRTGRASQNGKAITLVGSTEWNLKSSIERYLNVRFRNTLVEGLKANYSGPKKLKSSGKAAGTKKKTSGAAKPAKARSKKSSTSAPVNLDGNAPIKRKIKPTPL